MIVHARRGTRGFDRFLSVYTQVVASRSYSNRSCSLITLNFSLFARDYRVGDASAQKGRSNRNCTKYAEPRENTSFLRRLLVHMKGSVRLLCFAVLSLLGG